MRRTLLLVAALLVVGIPVALYFRGSSPVGPSKESEEVMTMAAQKSRDLQSARMNAEGQFRLEGDALPASGTVKADGLLQDSGGSVQLAVSLDALVAPGGDRSQTFRIEGAIESLFLSQRELFFKVNSLSTEPNDRLFQPEVVSLLTGKWWSIPTGEAEGEQAAMPGGSVTPPPSVLRAQAQVVRVTEDRGTDTLDGAKAHHYRVILDPEKLLRYLEEVGTARGETLDRAALSQSLAGLQATGDMWIDAQSYLLKKVTWDIQRLETGLGLLSGSFTIVLSDFDAAPTVSPPTDAQPFSPAAFFGVSEGQQGLTEEQLEQYRSLIDDVPAS